MKELALRPQRRHPRRVFDNQCSELFGNCSPREVYAFTDGPKTAEDDTCASYMRRPSTYISNPQDFKKHRFKRKLQASREHTLFSYFELQGTKSCTIHHFQASVRITRYNLISLVNINGMLLASLREGTIIPHLVRYTSQKHCTNTGSSIGIKMPRPYP